MNNNRLLASVAVLLLLGVAGVSGMAAGLEGTATVGWVFIDDEGNRSVDHSTYNLYEGGTVSLERFRYQMDNGLRFFGNLRNITMNNRNLNFGMAKSGHGELRIAHNKYRRIYNFEGSRSTRREQTRASLWFSPVQYVRLFGGFGHTDKHGSMVRLFEVDGISPAGLVDYTQDFWHGGATFTYHRSTLTAEVRGSTYSDDINTLADRDTRRYRVTAASPLPWYDGALLNAGFQRYEGYLINREDSLIANTFWLGSRLYYSGGYSLRYSFMWDRARRTGDFTATDNLAHTVFASKTWRGLGGIEAGYRYQINDDVGDELRSDGYQVSGWINPVEPLTLRAGFGMLSTDVEAGQTLTGNRDRMNHWFSAKYKHRVGQIRAKVEMRETEYDDIGSSADYVRYSTDVSVSLPVYGRLIALYSLVDGEWENSVGTFEYRQHIVSGDILSREYRNAQVGVGGLYTRSKRDVDIERFSLSFSAGYRFMDVYRVEGRYTAYNYDDFNDDFANYTQYYTSNVVEFSLSRSL